MINKHSAAIAIAIGALVSMPASAANTLGIAFAGNDPVAHTQGSSAQGQAQFYHLWNGAVWYFSNAENRESFMAEPEVYAPQFDAYCAWAASQGYKRPGDPNVTQIVEGKLYTFVHEGARRKWQENITQYIADGESNWVNIEPF